MRKRACPQCSGNKTYRDLGCVPIKCPKCNGQGVIDVEQQAEKEKKNGKDKKTTGA